MRSFRNIGQLLFYKWHNIHDVSQNHLYWKPLSGLNLVGMHSPCAKYFLFSSFVAWMCVKLCEISLVYGSRQECSHLMKNVSFTPGSNISHWTGHSLTIFPPEEVTVWRWHFLPNGSHFDEDITHWMSHMLTETLLAEWASHVIMAWFGKCKYMTPFSSIWFERCHQ